MAAPDPFALRDLLGPTARICRRALTGDTGVALPAFTDHHVHSHLVDIARLPAGGIAAVVDLGGDPVELSRRPRQSMPRLAYAGAFLTAPSGYPIGRAWAPPAIARAVTGHAAAGVADGAETVVDEQAEFGASVIKVALHADAGPVFAVATLAAIVARAHERGLEVVAHVEGDGMTRLALDGGVAVLAHTPFTERLDPPLIARAVSAGQRWISTLAIHTGAADDAQRAIANLAAFRDAGGAVLYGTDLGNGDQPLGINPAELHRLADAGVRGAELIAALADPWPLSDPPQGVATFVPGPPPLEHEEVPDWLAGATVIAAEELIDDVA